MTVRIAVASALLAAGLTAAGMPAHAQDACATFFKAGMSLPGLAGAKPETHKSGNNTICELSAPDRAATLRLIVEPASAASGLAMRKMLAANSKDPGLKSKGEPSLGANAFSFATRQQVSFSAAGKAGVYHLTLDRDAGIGPGDEDGLRAIERQLVGGS